MMILGEARRATMRGKEAAELGCTCGATIAVTVTAVPGAVIGGMERAFQSFRELHSEPDCLYKMGVRKVDP